MAEQSLVLNFRQDRYALDQVADVFTSPSSDGSLVTDPHRQNDIRHQVLEVV